MANEAKYSLPRVMTVKELSDYLRVHPSTIYKLLRRGELPGFRIGTDWRFNAEVIDRWCLERNMKVRTAALPARTDPRNHLIASDRTHRRGLGRVNPPRGIIAAPVEASMIP